jgi:hypothetical protein
VSSHGSLDSHWHRPLHITSFLSEMMLTRPAKAVNVARDSLETRESPVYTELR